MLSINPFADLVTVIPAFLMQYFVIAMVLLIIVGTGLDMLHKKNVVYFFRNAQKAKKLSSKGCYVIIIYWFNYCIIFL